jgi:hypothetical protein
MSNVFKIDLHRDQNGQSGFVRQQSAIVIAPTQQQGFADGKTKKPVSDPTLPPLGAAELLLGKESFTLLMESMGGIKISTSTQSVTVKQSNDSPVTMVQSSVPKVQSAEVAFNRFFYDLKEAFDANNIEKLDDLASTYQREHAVGSLSQLDRFSREVYEFFNAYEGQLTSERIQSFVKRYNVKDLTTHMEMGTVLVSKLKGQLIAGVVQKSLGKQSFDVQRLLLSTVAGSMIATHALQNRDREKINDIFSYPVTEVLHLPLQLPEWIWLIDPCRMTSTPLSPFSISPLGKRISHFKANQPSKDMMTTRSDKGIKSDKETKSKCNCDCEEAPCLLSDPCCAKINYYVTDTLVLRDKILKYKPSDIAYIENIMAHEKRERIHSFTHTIEDYTETETTSTKSEQRDHQVTDRFSVQAEMEKQFKASLDVKGEYNSGAYSVETKVGLSYETAQKEAREQFKESVTKAVSTIQTELRTLTSRREITENKEVNTHGFQASPTHNVGKFFYVSKLVEGQVYGYGKRLTVEVLIPSPWALYKELERRKMLSGMPCVPDVITIDDVNPEKYRELQKTYCVKKLPSPPKQGEPFDRTYANQYTEKVEKGLTNSADYKLFDVIVPQGYKATRLSIASPYLHENSDANKSAAIIINGIEIFSQYRNKNGDVTGGSDSGAINESTDFTVYVQPQNLIQFGGDFIVHFEPLPVDYTDWKKKVAKIINKSNRKKVEDAYIVKYKETQKGRHPFVDKEILMAEIKRAAIYMMCEDFEREGVMSWKTEPCGYPEMVRPEAGTKTRDWYFWERAFDWNLMSFKFYDYFWNDMCKWPETFHPDHPNYMFNAFLRAGFMRVMLPAGVGMDQDVLWYIKTKEKWGPTKDYPTDPSDPRWVNVVQELKWSRDCYQNDREGMVIGVLDPITSVKTNEVIIKGTNRYWHMLSGAPDISAISEDIGRQIFIDGIAYVIQSISQASPAPSIANPLMNWRVKLERVFEGAVNVNPTDNSIFPQYPFAVGAEVIGSPFQWEEPTGLVWLGDYEGDHKDCLPTYPIEC